MKCIYCLEDRCFTKTEHIIPQSFGLFKNNFVLNKIVCDNCNQFFGNNLEIDLARDTLEGNARFEYKLKDHSEFKSFGKRSRLRIRIAEGFFKGAYAYRYYSRQEDRVLVKPLPQIGFLKSKSSEYDFFLLDQMPLKDSLSKEMYDLNNPQGIIMLECDPEMTDKILKDKGFVLKMREIYDSPYPYNNDLSCEVEAELDQRIFRAIAKIGFNYLTYWKGAIFVMQSDFDPIRRYIRFGEKKDYPLIRVIDRAILSDEISSDQRFLGHIITVNWATDGVSIIAQVSLFNWLTYCVCLARNFSGEKRQITRGHFFNTDVQEILDIVVIKKA